MATAVSDSARRARAGGGLAAVLLCLLLAALAGCARPPDQERVRAVVDKAARAMEAKDLKAFMSCLSKGFTDDHGNDRDMVRSILFGRFMRRGSIRVFTTALDVEVKGAVARADVRLVVVAGLDLSGIKSIKDVIPEDAQGFEVSVVFRKEEDEWLAVGANWMPTGLVGIF